MKNNLKIGILTQPLHDNYGGLLQAYALKEVLKSLGHEVVIINRQFPSVKIWRLMGSTLKRIIKEKTFIDQKKLTKYQLSVISKETVKFRGKYIKELSKPIQSTKEMKTLNNNGFDAFIVGSDQCWRPVYSPNIYNYFLDFTKGNNKIKRISYAASFGVSDWEFTKKQTVKCRKFLRKFDTVSVREDSGVKLVEKYFDRKNVIHVLDPTMLLQKSNYLKIIKQDNIGFSKGRLKVYVLDKSNEKNKFIKLAETALELKVFEVMPKKRVQDHMVNNSNITDFQYPNPTQWLKGFSDAEFVITDSFHGTLFSILFNVPFITISNEQRGIARFSSLLKMFGFSNRLVTDMDKADLDFLLNKDIDWSFANKVIDIERAKALDFLTRSLK